MALEACEKAVFPSLFPTSLWTSSLHCSQKISTHDTVPGGLGSSHARVGFLYDIRLEGLPPASHTELGSEMREAWENSYLLLLAS